MNCFPCFQRKKGKENNSKKNDDLPVAEPRDVTSPPPVVNNNLRQAPVADADNKAEDNAAGNENSGPRTFTFRELAAATKNFRQECLLGEGGFGRVFKGTLSQSGETVAVRQLDRNGAHGGKEFAAEISDLSRLHHPNLVKLIGYCADGDQRLLVYEYMPSGSLKKHLFDVQTGKKPLDWSTRMKIALGIAEGVEFLHEKASPPIIYRDLKSSNILLDESNNPKLSEYGLAKLVKSGNSIISPRVMAAYGYCAPEYERQGELTLKSDVYSFGVVLLELITGRTAMDTTRPADEQNLVSWAQPIFRDPSRFPDMADPLLKKQFPVTSLNQAVGVAAMCLQEEPMARPLISDISAALGFLAMAPPETPIPARLMSILSARVSTSSALGGDYANSARMSTSSAFGDNSRLSTSSQSGDQYNSLGHKNISCRTKDEYSDISDLSDGSDYDDDDEEEAAADSVECESAGTGVKARSELNESKALASGSKRGSRRAASRRDQSNPISRGPSVGSRRDTESNPPKRQDSMQESDDYDDSSSGDEQSLNHRSRKTSAGVTSRKGSKRDPCNGNSSSKVRQESFVSDYSYLSSEDEDINNGSKSRSNSIVDSGSRDKSPNKTNLDSGSGDKGPGKSNADPVSSNTGSVQKVKSAVDVGSVPKVKFEMDMDSGSKNKGPPSDVGSVPKVRSGIDVSSVPKVKFGSDADTVRKVKSGVTRRS